MFCSSCTLHLSNYETSDKLSRLRCFQLFQWGICHQRGIIVYLLPPQAGELHIVVMRAASWLALTQRQGLDPSPFLKHSLSCWPWGPVCSRKSDVLPLLHFSPHAEQRWRPPPPPSAPAPIPDLPYLRLWTEDLVKMHILIQQIQAGAPDPAFLNSLHTTL